MLGLTSCSLSEVKNSISQSWIGQNILHPILDFIRGNESGKDSSKTSTLGIVTDLKFASSAGQVEWSSVTGATEYEYTVDNKLFAKTSETSLNIFDVVKDVSVTELKVRAVNGDKVGDFSSLSFTTKKLATPNKGKLAVDEKTHENIIVWDAVEEASSYLVSVNDKNFVTYQTNEFKASTTGDYYIKVKCKAYVKNRQIVYLESDVSEKSETLSYIPGPTLSLYALNQISWSSGYEFDSYNVYIDGVKARENVSSPLDLVTGENPIITKTGEYNIQIEAIKNGVSYWSNVQEEVGTSNINPGEIYSFDNRKFNRVVPSQQDPGWVVSNEQAHSAPYSLYLPTQTQVNLQKYAASGINDIDFRDITKASYWVYIPEVPGYSESTISTKYLPKIIYDGWGASAEHERATSRPKEASVTIGEWCQVHFEVELQNEQILIFGPGSKITIGEEEFYIPMYIDDICYDELLPISVNETSPELKYDYKFRYDFDLCGGAWSNKPLRFHFNDDGSSKLLPPNDNYVDEADLTSAFANQSVEISMDICGTADPDGTVSVGFGAFDQDKKLTGMFEPIKRSDISTLEYHTVSFLADLDEHGDFYTTIYEYAKDENESLTVFARNVKCEESKYSTGTLVPKHANVNNTYVSVLAISTNLEAGSDVEVTMDVAVKTTGDYSELRTAGLLWSTGTPRYTRILSNAELKESNDFRSVTFHTRVLNTSEINFHDGESGYTHSFEGNYILVYLHGHLSTDFFYYKNVNVEQIGSLNPSGDNNVGADMYYQSIGVLKTSLPVATLVNVEMDVKTDGTFNDYSGIYWVDSVYTVDGGEVKDKTNIASSALGEEWHHISFDARVRNFANFRFNSSFPIVDTSNEGNGVYLISRNKSVFSMCYKNVSFNVLNESLTPAGDNGNTNDTYYQSIAGLKTTLEVGTTVAVEMDVNVTGEFNSYSGIYWVDSVYSVAGGELKDKTEITSLINNGETGWHHVSFLAKVNNFENLRFNSSFPIFDTSNSGNAVYLIARNKSVDAFDYNNVTLTPVESLIPAGDNGNTSNTYYQSIAGLKTDFAVGTMLTVEMDVYVTGTFDTYSRIYAADSVYSVAGGELNAKTDITSVINNGESGWHHVSFNAFVRNFEALRYNSAYSVYDTSSIGNAIYLIAMNKSADSFAYKNVTLTPVDTLIPAGNNGNTKDTYYQSIVGLKTNYEVGTKVIVEMDVYVTGTYNSYSDIFVADSVYSTAGGELNGKTTITSIINNGETGWHHVSFNATVRNFSALRRNSSYPVFDTSSYGNAVYLLSMNKSADSFAYKNVSFTAIKSMTPAGDNGNSADRYYQSISVLETDLEVGTLVTVTMDIKITGTFNQYCSIYAVNTVWSNNVRNEVTSIMSLLDTSDTSSWQTITFEAYVRNFDLLRQSANHPEFDTSSYGNGVYLIANNKTANSFDFTNVVITAKA